MKLYFKNSISLFSSLIFTLALICSQQIAKADPFDILFDTATYTNGQQTQKFLINCGDIVVLPNDSGGTLSFVVYAFSLSISNSMYLSSGPLPPGGSFPSAFGSNYVQSTFTWTPNEAFLGNIIFQLRGTATVDCSVSFDWPLPVELISFIYFVYGNNVTLNWQTSSENNNSKFIIERNKTTDGNNNVWSRAGSVPGNGTTSTSSDYTFIDRNLNSGVYKYRLKQEDFNGNFEYHYLSSNVQIGLPEKFDLSQNYPNPFNPVTKINYGLPNTNFVSLKVYDVLGKEVITLVNEKQNAGSYTVDFNGANLSSGVFFYRIQIAEFAEIKRMMLIK